MRPMFDTARQRQQRGQPVELQSALENECNKMAAADAWRGERLAGTFEVGLSPRVKKGDAGQKVECRCLAVILDGMGLSLEPHRGRC